MRGVATDRCRSRLEPFAFLRRCVRPKMNQLPLSSESEKLTPSACCCQGWQGWGLLLALVAIATAGGYLAGKSAPPERDRSDAWAAERLPMLDATSAVSSERYSIATGIISDESEGFFVLDHSTGILQCRVYSPRLEAFNATFTANVAEVLAVGGKGGGYLLITGQADMTRGRRAAQVAPLVVYVLHTATGNYGAFAVPFDRQLAVTGRPQVGNLVPIPTGMGTASVLPTR